MNFNDHVFLLIDADEYCFNYMEDQGTEVRSNATWETSTDPRLQFPVTVLSLPSSLTHLPPPCSHAPPFHVSSSLSPDFLLLVSTLLLLTCHPPSRLSSSLSSVFLLVPTFLPLRVILPLSVSSSLSPLFLLSRLSPCSNVPPSPCHPPSRLSSSLPSFSSLFPRSSLSHVILPITSLSPIFLHAPTLPLTCHLPFQFLQSNLSVIMSKLKAAGGAPSAGPDAQGTMPYEQFRCVLLEMTGFSLSEHEVMTVARAYQLASPDCRMELPNLISVAQEELRKANFEEFKKVLDQCQYYDRDR